MAETQAPLTTPASHSSDTGKVSLNKASPQVIANEHHSHGCCNGKYHCDGSKCPNGRVLNPAIGIPLAICTAGLSSAAIGVYKGVRDHKLRKETKEAYDKEQRRQSNLEAENPASNDFLTPSTQSLEKNGHSLKEAEAGIERGLGSKNSEASELDSTPLSAPPQYAAELDSNEVVRHEKPAD